MLDARDSLLLPGFIMPRPTFAAGMIGAMGLELMDSSAAGATGGGAMADPAYAAGVASEFVSGLAASGTTAALVFGSHFPTGARNPYATAAVAGGLRFFVASWFPSRGLLPALDACGRAGCEQGLS